MERLQKASILVELIRQLHENQSWCGETHIQKTTYFLQKIAKVPLGFEFILYKHGPFSFDLSDEINSLRADGILALVPQPYPFGPKIVISQLGEKLFNLFPKTIKKYETSICTIAKKFGKMSVSELERYATAFYVIEEKGEKEDVSRLASMITDLKPHIKIEDACSAVGFMKKFIGEFEKSSCVEMVV